MIRKAFLFTLTLLLATNSVLYPAFAAVQNENGDFVTNQLTAEYDLFAERFSDIEGKLTGPQNFSKDILTQAASDGKVKIKSELGTQTDERDGCVEVKKNKRVGICQDGIYSLETYSYDAAGNKSNKTTIRAERDTVKPEAPRITRLEICGNNICALLKSEVFTTLLIDGAETSNLTSENSYVVIKYGWNSDTTYTFNFSLKDLAGNTSEGVIKSIRTPLLLAYRGTIDGASSENPYANYSLDDFNEVKFKVKLNTLDGSYQIEQYEIPAPILTMIFTDYDKKIDIYGLGINKNWKGIAEVEKFYPSYSEARDKCEAGFFSGFDGNNCVLNTMNVSYGELWKIADEKCGSITGYGTYRCIFGNQDNFRKKSEFYNIEFNIENTMISFHNESQSDKYIGSDWNDSSNGKFQKAITLNDDLREFDNIRSRLAIFGEFEVDGQKINYRGVNKEKAKENFGLWSGFSNSLQVDKSEYIALEDKKAKILDVPYFNQFLEPDGSTYPPSGGVMCGAASAVMIVGYFKKLTYSDDHDLKKYMYSDSGQGLGNPCNDPLMAGAFGVTQIDCEQNLLGGIWNYLEKNKLKYNAVAVYDYKNSIQLPALSYDIVKTSIDNNRPLIVSVTTRNIAHIFVIIGYTEDGFAVVNDPYRDLQDYSNSNYSYTGNRALYDVSKTSDWSIGYAIEVYE